MVDVCNKHCFHDSCTRKPSFIVKGIKQTVYRKQHAEEGMVDVCKKHYCTDSWTRKPSFNVKGSRQPVFCKQHAEVSMVDVCKKHNMLRKAWSTSARSATAMIHARGNRASM